MYAKLRQAPPPSLAVADKAIYDFSNQWLAGLRPQLSLETGPDGQIWVSSQVVAGDVPTHAKLVLRQHTAEEAGPHHRHRPRHHDRDVAYAVKLHEQLQKQLTKLWRKLSQQ